MSQNIRAVVFDTCVWDDKLAQEWLEYNDFDNLSFVSYGGKSMCIVDPRDYTNYEYRKCSGYVGIHFIIAIEEYIKEPTQLDDSE